MTWYWWSHWFWITFSHVLINVSPIGSIDTISPFKPNQHNNKREPLKFPIAVDSDSDDDIFGVDNENLFKSDLIESDQTGWISNSDKVIDNNLHNNKDEDIHVVVDYNSKNNRTNSNNNNNNNNNSLNSNLDKTEKINNINSTIKNVSTIANKYNSPNVLSTSTIDTLVATSINSSSTEIGSGDTPYTESNILSTSENQTNDDIDNIGFQENDTKPEYEPSRRKSKILQEYRDDPKVENITDDNKTLLARSAEIIAQSHNEINSDSLSSEALSIHDEQSILNVGAISGICAIVIGFFFAFSITGIVLYRRRYINKPQTLSEPDSSGYIDDSTIRDNSDEMYSLDNDSFLNSLEAMTIQNYWTENVKHTKL